MSGTVRLVAGDGIVCRRSTELLYSPTGSTDLLQAFRTAPPGRLRDVVTQLIDASDDSATAPPFAVVDWSGDVLIAVFGDVELTSDHRSPSRLSAAGAGTWIERTLRDVGEVTIGVRADDADPETDLELGVVRAGGFAVTCSAGSSRPDPSENESPAPTSPRTDVADERVATADPMHSDASIPGPPSHPVDRSEPVESTSAPVPSLADELAASVLEPPVDDGGGSPLAAGPDDVTIVPDDAMRDEIADILGVESPPASKPAPSWLLRFTDGPVEPVDRTLILGRKPIHRDGETEATTRLLVLDCAQVSGRHLAVQVDNGRVAVIDLGSSNGSFVVTSGDGQLIRLEPGVPQPLDGGTIVQIGTKRFTVEAAE